MSSQRQARTFPAQWKPLGVPPQQNPPPLGGREVVRFPQHTVLFHLLMEL